MSRAITNFASACVVLLWVACGGDDGGGGGGASSAQALRCTIGEVRVCPCTGGGMGTQTCSMLGDSFGACTGCPAPVAGQAGAGSAGVGGASGASSAGASGAAAGGSGAGAGAAGQAGAGQAGTGLDGGTSDAGADGDVDASTEPSGQAGTQPGVSCGVGLPALCELETEKCCTRSLGTDTCIAASATCDCDISGCEVMEVHCDGPEDCPSGQVCCGTLAGSGAAYQDFSCAAQCQATGNQRVACHQDDPVCPSSLQCANSQLLTNIQVCIDPATIMQ
jgi:hypothetical protein